MPIELAVRTTGHDIKSVSAFFEYVDPSRALCIPGAIVLADFPALPWGQHGMGSVPPNLHDLLGPSKIGRLDTVIDILFKINSDSHPHLKVSHQLVVSSRQQQMLDPATCYAFFPRCPQFP
jgi:hypothetical protein